MRAMVVLALTQQVERRLCTEVSAQAIAHAAQSEALAARRMMDRRVGAGTGVANFEDDAAGRARGRDVDAARAFAAARCRV